MHCGLPAATLLIASLIVAVPPRTSPSSRSTYEHARPQAATCGPEAGGRQAEAGKHHWPVAVTIVDSAGFLVAFHRLDNTQLGSIEVSLEKAKTSAMFRRPSKYFEDAIAQGGAGLRALRTGVMPVEGGLPIIQDGKLIGAIGVSGAKPSEDGQVARAGLAALVDGPKQ